jgi:hypothetical protein
MNKISEIINFVIKTSKFVKNYFFNDPIFVMKYGIRYFQDSYKISPTFLKQKVIVEKIINQNMSYIRFGDGEVALIKMLSIHFQKSDKFLSKKLKEIIINYNENSKYILARPQRYVFQTNADLKKLSNENVNMFRCWLPFKIAFEQYFPKEIKYADAHSFYVKGFFENNLSEYLKNKNIIIATNINSINKQKTEMEKVFNNIFWIETKAENSFSEYSKYENEINQVLQNKNVSDFVLLLSTGPTSKVLAYHFADMGLQSLDIGHGFEHLYKNTGLDHVLI